MTAAGSVPGVQEGVTTGLRGWGGTSPSVAAVVDVTRDDLGRTVKAAGPRGAIVRGLGRSYGDAAQNGGGLVVRLGDEAISLDADTGEATVDAGVSLDTLMRAIVPQGWFVPVTPGTRFVTVGGAIASDIHGKNHHVDGSFGNHVTRFSLLLASGEVRDVSPTAEPELFWATVGGMGLTGVILDATVRLLPVATSRMLVETRRLPDLDAVLAAMTERDHLYRYSVSWVDLLAKGRSLGRSVSTWGDHAPLDALDGVDDPLAFAPRQLATVPPVVPGPGLVHHLTASVFNELWFRKAPRHRVDEVQSIAAYFHPLDGVGEWNRLYGRRGFVQYQFVVPFGEEDTLRRVVERLVTSGASSPLVVLKRFGDANPAPLSFPSPGWTLAVDLPAGAHGLSALCRDLDEMVLTAGGRHYLAKDAHATPQVIRRGYPRLDEWKAVRRSVDPDGVWQSDLARRLDLLS